MYTRFSLILSFLIAFFSGSGLLLPATAMGNSDIEPVCDEGHWEGPPCYDWESPEDFQGIYLTELIEQGPEEAQPAHSGYTLIRITDTPSQRLLPFVRQSIDKLLLSAQESYLDIHREGGRLGPDAEALLSGVGSGPDRFLDGRSSYALIVKGTADQIVQKLMSSEKFPKSDIQASLRVSTVSHDAPLLPFATYLDNLPAPLAKPPQLQDLKMVPLNLYSWVSHQHYPFTTPELMTLPVNKFSRPDTVAGNEVKSFMVRRESDGGATRDWMPYLFQSLEQNNVLSLTGYYLDRMTGEVLRDGDPKIKEWTSAPRPGRFIDIFGDDKFQDHRFGWIHAEYHFAEILSTRTMYNQYLATGKPQGLLKMYLGYGFEIETDSIKILENYDDLMVIPLMIKREDWLKAVAGTERRPGQKHISKTHLVSRTFPGVVRRLGLLPDQTCETILQVNAESTPSR